MHVFVSAAFVIPRNPTVVSEPRYKVIGLKIGTKSVKTRKPPPFAAVRHYRGWRFLTGPNFELMGFRFFHGPLAERPRGFDRALVQFRFSLGLLSLCLLDPSPFGWFACWIRYRPVWPMLCVVLIFRKLKCIIYVGFVILYDLRIVLIFWL